MAETDDFPLHASVFKDDKRKVSQLLRSHDASEKDIHGKDLCVLCLREICRGDPVTAGSVDGMPGKVFCC